MKILILRFSSIGDIVLTSPVIRCLHRQTGAEIHYLSKKAYEPILAYNPYLSKTWFFEKEVSEVLPELKLEQFDWVIDLHHNLRSFRVKWALGRPARSFEKLNFEKWLLVQTKIDRMPKLHIVDRYMETVRDLGVIYDGEGLDYFFPPDSVQIPVELPAGPYIAFAIGATHATKRLPVDKIGEICTGIRQSIVLLGGPDEVAAGAMIASQCPNTINACGLLTLHQSAMVLKNAWKVITHDTGMMHIAAAFRKEIVSIWGSTTPKFGMFPFYPNHLNLNHVVEIPGLSCRPCSKIGFDACPKGHFRCMRDIDPRQIWETM